MSREPDPQEAIDQELKHRAREERRAIAAAGLNSLANAIERLAAARRVNVAAMLAEADALSRLREERRRMREEAAAAEAFTGGNSEPAGTPTESDDAAGAPRKPPARENGFKRELRKMTSAGQSEPAARTPSANRKA